MLMKKHIAMLLCTALAVLTVACGNKLFGGHAITQQDLIHHRFVLVSSDGKNFSAKDRVPSIEFNEGLQISGAACNRFTGQGRLVGNVLTVEKMASTKMFCSDSDFNELENLLARILSEGVELSLDGQHLFLRQGGHKLIYKLSDWVR